MTTYLLIASDAYRFDQGRRSALLVAKARLERKIWPLYPRTSFARAIATEDRCLIYLAGNLTNRQSTIASALVDSVEDWRKDDWFEEEELLCDTPRRVINFSEVAFFTNPIEVRPLLTNLEMVKSQTDRWGSYFQGGVKRISTHDEKLLSGSTV